VHDGCLWLALKKEKAGGKSYTGGGVISKSHFKFGYYEARFKVPPTKGWHSSFWMMKHDGSGGTGGEAATQELDVCENDSINLDRYAADEEIWPKGTDVGSIWVSTPDLSADFHVWGCEFAPDKVTYYFDGKVVGGVETAKLGKLSEQNIWLTAIASSMGNTDAVDDSQLPVYAVYDYVRFYERK
jgi:beta-glucanase (GH16 family)